MTNPHLVVCPKCGAETVGVTCLDDTHWQFLCVACGATSAGELIDPAFAATERAKFEALCEDIRRRDRSSGEQAE